METLYDSHRSRRMPRGRIPHDLTGQVFSRLTAIEAVGSHSYGGVVWRCQCECGNETRALARLLRSGQKKSCGCLRHDATGRQIVHGHSKTNSPTYGSWASMRTRCNDTKCEQYPRYGGRGITICDRWNSFQNFLEDMGERPEGMTLGRKDNDGPYSPENCRWETPKQQARNRSDNVLLSYDGRQVTLAEYCELTGQHREKLRYDISRGKLALADGSPA